MRLAELTDKYKTMTRAADQGALDGANNIPEPNAMRLSETELNIRNLAQGDLDEVGVEQKVKVDDELASITERASKIPFVVRRTLGEFRVLAEAIVQESGHELIGLYKIKLEREKDYRLFKVFHRLRREAAPARSLFEAWAYITLMLVIDGSLNAFFFKDVGSFGLADGFLIAAVMAACNIALGFMVGWGPLRFFGHRYRLHLLWAVPVFVLLLLVIASFNWGVAHYRDLVQLDSKSTFPEVWNTLWTSPFAIMSFPSYLMALVGIGVAVYAAARAYTMFDAYPWYGWTYKRMKAAEAEFLANAATIKTKIQTEGEKFLAAAAKDYEAVNAAAHELLADYDKIMSRIDQYEATAQSIEDACNAVLRIYRVQNVQVRDVVRFPPPAYFDDRVALRRRADMQSKDDVAIERDALQKRAEQLRKSQQDLERQVPEVKLELLSEARMNQRLEDIMQKAKERHEVERIMEEEERATAV